MLNKYKCTVWHNWLCVSIIFSNLLLFPPLAWAHPPLQPRHRIISLCLLGPWHEKFLLTTDYCQQDKKTFTISWVELYIDLTQLQMDWEEERVFHLSKNIFAMDLANILHAEDRFFSALHKNSFVTRRCLEQNTYCCTMIDCCQTTVPKHKNCFICLIAAIQIVDC